MREVYEKYLQQSHKLIGKLENKSQFFDKTQQSIIINEIICKKIPLKINHNLSIKYNRVSLMK